MPSATYDAALAAAAREHAGGKTFSGKFLRPHKPWLVDLTRRLGITSALDYGCGKGAQYAWVDPVDGQTIEEAMGFEIAKFDPAWPPFATEPTGPFDLVICTHVLGSIPVDDLPWVLSRLFSLAAKAVFIAERVGPLRKKAVSIAAGRERPWTSLEWIEAIAPYRRAWIETHFCVRYQSASGERFTGRFQI